MADDIKIVENDEFISVRNVLIPKESIKEIEGQMPGCKLVSDIDVALIYELDEVLKKFRKAHKRDPAVVRLEKYPAELFFPVQINLASPIPSFTGPTIKARHDRPAWFRLRRSFVV